MNERSGRGILGRRGLIVGVLILIAVALLGGRRLLHGRGGSVAGIDQALNGLAPFAPVAPTRAAIGTTGDRWARYAALATAGAADWRAAFAAAGRPWASPRWPVAVPPPMVRPAIVVTVGTRLGDWVQQLAGIRGLLGVQQQAGTLSSADVAVRIARLDACLAGAWGRSVASPAALATAASPALAGWVARGAATGLPASCTAAAAGATGP